MQNCMYAMSAESHALFDRAFPIFTHLMGDIGTDSLEVQLLETALCLSWDMGVVYPKKLPPQQVLGIAFMVVHGYFSDPKNTPDYGLAGYFLSLVYPDPANRRANQEKYHILMCESLNQGLHEALLSAMATIVRL